MARRNPEEVTRSEQTIHAHVGADWKRRWVAQLGGLSTAELIRKLIEFLEGCDELERTIVLGSVRDPEYQIGVAELVLRRRAAEGDKLAQDALGYAANARELRKEREADDMTAAEEDEYFISGKKPKRKSNKKA